MEITLNDNGTSSLGSYHKTKSQGSFRVWGDDIIFSLPQAPRFRFNWQKVTYGGLSFSTKDSLIKFLQTEIFVDQTPGTAPTRKTLTIDLGAYSESFTVLFDGVEQTGESFEFVAGIEVKNVSVQIEGYTVSPLIVESVVMDADKTLTFEATAE